MYRQRHFEQNDPAALAALMRDFPLATLVSQGEDGLTADHVPLLYDAEANVLRGHVARANPVWEHANGRAVLAVFRADDAYVTPGWYATKRESGKVVPTWNYAVVHAHGTLRAIEDATWLHRLVSALTERHEAARAEPWAVSDAPDDYIAQMLRAIVGIEIAVTRMQGKWKLSQNRSAADREGVVRGLREMGHAAMADAVAKGTAEN